MRKLKTIIALLLLLAVGIAASWLAVNDDAPAPQLTPDFPNATHACESTEVAQRDDPPTKHQASPQPHPEESPDKPSAEELRRRHERATERLETAKERLQEMTDGGEHLPEVPPDFKPDEEELRREAEENLERLREYQESGQAKIDRAQRRVSHDREEKRRLSAEYLAALPPYQVMPKHSTAEQRRRLFSRMVEGAFKKFFAFYEEPPAPEQEARRLVDLLESCARFAGYTNPSMPESVEKAAASIERGSNLGVWPVGSQYVEIGRVPPLDPSREFAHWWKREPALEWLAALGDQKLTPLQSRLALELACTMALAWGPDRVHESASVLIKRLPYQLEDWDKDEAQLLFKGLQRITPVLFRGGGVDEIRNSLLAVQGTLARLALHIYGERDEGWWSDDPPVAIDEINTIAIRAAARLRGRAVSWDELERSRLELDDIMPGHETTLSAVELEQVRDLGNTWARSVLLAEPLGLLVRAEDADTLLEDFRALLATAPELSKLMPLAENLGACCIDLLVDELSLVHGATRLRNATRVYRRLFGTTDYSPLIMTSDQLAFAQALVRLNIELVDLGPVYWIVELGWLGTGTFGYSAEECSVYSSRPLSFQTPVSARTRFDELYVEYMVKTGTSPLSCLAPTHVPERLHGDHSRHLGYELQPDLARQWLAGMVEAGAQHWQEHGRQLGDVLARMTGIRMDDPHDHRSIRAWMKVLNVD